MTFPFRITGLEFLSNRLETTKGFIHYPRELKVFTHSRDVIDWFPAPVKDKNGVSSKAQKFFLNTRKLLS